MTTPPRSGLFEKYQQLINSGQYLPDPAQENIILILDDLCQTFLQNKNLLRKLFLASHKPAFPKSLYIWGSVGRGKTWIMDLFFEHLTFTAQKWRVHFHAFMREIHLALQQEQNQSNPLEKIARRYAKKIKVLCLDEFFITDIADAMILAELLRVFFKHEMLIILTSNAAPDDLYPNGLQRSKFLPAIDLIKKHTTILHLETHQDYRLRELEKSGVFFCPPNPAALERLFLKFNYSSDSVYSPIKNNQNNPCIYLYDRPIPAKAIGKNIIWFDYQVLCSIPRSQLDYLQLAQKFNIIILDNLDQISPENTNTARYFINLIDILYDAKILLILSSAVEIIKLYPAGELAQEFKRTQSRLIEMQSTHYLKAAEEKLCPLKP